MSSGHASSPKDSQRSASSDAGNEDVVSSIRSPKPFILRRPIKLIRTLDGLRVDRNATGDGILPQFIPGDENRFAAFVATGHLSVVQSGNPLLIVGPSGSGKTAIALHLAARQNDLVDADEGIQTMDRPPLKTLVISSVDFARCYANAVDNDAINDFRDATSRCDVLVIEDIDKVPDKAAAQNEMSLLIDSRSKLDRPTILTCRRLPSQLRSIRPMLASRMLPGLTLALSPPSPSSRIELLKRLVDQTGVRLSDAGMDLLAGGLPQDVTARGLHAALQAAVLHSQAHGCDVEDSLSAVIEGAAKPSDLTTAKIAKSVARRFKLKTSDLKSDTRKAAVVKARSLAMYLARQFTESSLQQIGEYFGGRDHTTVLHACRKTKSLLESNSELSIAADELTQQLRVG
ncbi:MAG: helix-turn-helix domain-containing protein [Planctomycetota bacterium]